MDGSIVPSAFPRKTEALQTLFYDPTPFTRLRLRSPSPTPGGANCWGPMGRFGRAAFEKGVSFGQVAGFLSSLELGGFGSNP